jgi:hypothetical protein
MSILENAKEIAALVKKYNDQELYQKIVDLRDEIFDIREENLELKARIKAASEAADISTQLRREGNKYLRTHPDGTKSGPYCMTCWDYERKLVNLLILHDGLIRCGRCDKPNR